MKRVFYYTDVLPLLSKKEVAIKKLKYNLSFFEERKDEVELYWYPYGFMGEYLAKNNSPVLEDFFSVLEEYEASGWGRLIFDEDPREMLKECDAYYGDASELAYYAGEDGHPALLIDYDCVGENA
ncbi:MAG: hypothetical protein K6F30_11070 [Lachnospiraceae bacterium]|nr:hypothetical protein [Lachnospiraceae bacterium]